VKLPSTLTRPCRLRAPRKCRRPTFARASRPSRITRIVRRQNAVGWNDRFRVSRGAVRRFNPRPFWWSSAETISGACVFRGRLYIAYSSAKPPRNLLFYDSADADRHDCSVRLCNDVTVRITRFSAYWNRCFSPFNSSARRRWNAPDLQRWTYDYRLCCARAFYGEKTFFFFFYYDVRNKTSNARCTRGRERTNRRRNLSRYTTVRVILFRAFSSFLGQRDSREDYINKRLQYEYTVKLETGRRIPRSRVSRR